jgi:hypothetical protein
MTVTLQLGVTTDFWWLGFQLTAIRVHVTRHCITLMATIKGGASQGDSSPHRLQHGSRGFSHPQRI